MCNFVLKTGIAGHGNIVSILFIKQELIQVMRIYILYFLQKTQ